jgi:hypothetical protein
LIARFKEATPPGMKRQFFLNISSDLEVIPKLLDK